MATIIGNSKANTITGSGSADTILAAGGADTIKANGGDDVIIAGSGGNDRIAGGSGIDTLVLSGGAASYAITFTTVTGADATALNVTVGTPAIQLIGPGGVIELVTGVETIVFDDKVIQIVGGGSLHSVQSAVDAATVIDPENPDSAGGQTVFIGAGTFIGNVTISGSQVDIIGQGASTVINGSLTFNTGGTVDAPLFVQDLAVTGGVTIGDQSDISLDRVTLSNSSGPYVVNLNGTGTATDISITNAVINETTNQMGIKVADGATVTGLTVSDTSFNGGAYGIYIANDFTAGDTVSGTFQGLTFNGQSTTDTSNTAFSSRAIYAEKLTNSTISGITVIAPESPLNDNLRGIELNLKNGAYSDITIDNVDFVGFNTNGATGTVFNPLLNVHTKPSATLEGILINDVTGSKVGGDAAGLGLSVVTVFDEAFAQHITDVTVTNLNVGGNVKIEASAYTSIANNTITGGDLLLQIVDQPATGSSLVSNTVSGTITMTDYRSVTLPEGADNLVLLDGPLFNIAGTGNSGDNVITGNSSNNILDGAGGDDTFIGGAGIDTVVYGAGATISRDGTGHWQVTDGAVTETLTGIEKVQIDGTTYLLVDKAGANVGGFQTVQSAIDAAGGGETILVAPGSYTEAANYAGSPLRPAD